MTITTEVGKAAEPPPAAQAGPRVLIVRVLEACNAGCFMCEFAHSREPYRFTEREASELAAAVAGGSLRVVRFTGGEPLMHAGMARIVEAFAAIGLIPSVITNGALLAARADELAEAGVGQFVVSLDAPQAAAHDRFRQTPGLFDAAVAGLRAVREGHPVIRTRVNTVAGPHNVDQLEEMPLLLRALGVDDWSIIPLKSADGPWRYPKPDQALESYRRFQAAIASSDRPRLVGHSRNWMGRTDDEIRRYLELGQPMTPRGSCRVVDVVRYYTPRSGVVYPCNCVPHRSAGVDLSVPWRLEPGGRIAGGQPVDWLRVNGPQTCTGCEPANVALGEGAIDLDLDPLGF